MNFIDQLKLITTKDISAITEADKLFLRARKSYLTGDQLAKYSFLSEPVSDELSSLQDKARKLGIKGVHFFKDIEKLRAKIEQVVK